MTKKRILLAEDDRLVRETVQELLEHSGFNVLAYADGREAMEGLDKEIPDLILSDIRMPNLDGFQFLEQARNKASLTPFIFMSAKAAPKDLRMGMSLGADDYVIKPFDPDDLLKAINIRLDYAERVRALIDHKEQFLMRYLPHELRTPLTGILGFSELMIASARDNNALSLLETEQFGSAIHTSGMSLLRIVENFCVWIDLSQRTEELPAQRNSWAVGKWEPEMQRRLVLIAETYGRRNDIHVALDPATLQVPADYLPQAVEQLVDNALKYSLPGTEVRVSGARTGGTYQIRVSDRGRGMTAEALGKIGLFQQFDRKKWEQQGLGIGLSIVSLFAGITGGKCTLERNGDGPGLQACLSLPIRDGTK